MKSSRTLPAMFLILLSLVLAASACQPEPITPPPGSPVTEVSRSPASPSPREPTQMESQASPAVGSNQTPPALTVGVQNADQLEAKLRVTNGMILASPFYSTDGSLFVAPTGAGVFLHRTDDFEQQAALAAPAYPYGLAALSEDNQLLAIGRIAGVAVFNTQDGSLLWQDEGAPGRLVVDLAISPDGGLLAAGYDDGTARVWLLPGGENVASLSGSQVEFSPDSQLLATAGGENRQVHLYPADSWVQAAEWSGDLAVFTPTGALGVQDGEAFRLFDPESRQAVQAFNGVQPAFSPDGSLLALFSLSQVQVFDAASGERLRVMEGEYAEIAQLRFSPDGKTLAAATIVEECPNCLTSLGPLALWRVSDGSLVQSIEGFNYAPWLAFDPRGGRLAAVEPDRLLFIDPETGASLEEVPAYVHGVLGLAFSPDGQFLATFGYPSDSARLWQVIDGSLALTLEDPARGMNHMVGNAAFSPDGKLLAVGADFWRLPEGVQAREIETATEQAYHSLAESVAFSPAEPLVALGIGEGYVDLWDLERNELAGPLTQNEGRALSLSYSPDGTRLAAALGFPDDAIQIWQFPERNLLTTIRGEPFFQVAFSPDGERLASLSTTDRFKERGVQAGVPRVWDSRDGQQLFALEVDDASSLAYSPDGELLATGSYDGSLRLWRASDGELLATYPAHYLPVGGLAFSPDGRLLASGSEDGSVLIWGFDR